MNNSKVKKGDILLKLVEGYKSNHSSIFNDIYGSYSGIIYDGKELIGFKDPIGAKPLYYSKTGDYFIISSELKALAPLETHIEPVDPGTTISSSGNKLTYYIKPKFTDDYQVTPKNVNYLVSQLKTLIKTAISDNINEGEKISGLLSGGIDSTIITHVAKDLIQNLKVYTVGVEGSKDVFYAKKYAKKYGIEHEILKIDLNDLLDVLPDVIYSLETFDAALIRSSVPMFLIAQKVKELDNPEVLLTGEGGDELFGGYEYLTGLQSSQALNAELTELLKVEHKTGLQRVDRIPYYFSIEARAPLFDRRLVEFAYKIPSELKICRSNSEVIKKWILRKAFENDIPDEFIWRKKQKFSNGAGSQFYLRDHFNSVILDEEFEEEKQITPNFTLRSKEELYYWRIFDKTFNPTHKTISNIGITSTYEI